MPADGVPREGVEIRSSSPLAKRAPLRGSPHPWICSIRALSKLEAEDPDAARLVELRFYGGLSIDEAAAVLGCSHPTVVRRWRSAKAWLLESLVGGNP